MGDLTIEPLEATQSASVARDGATKFSVNTQATADLWSSNKPSIAGAAQPDKPSRSEAGPTPCKSWITRLRPNEKSPAEAGLK
jgi:hypothetical protein